MEEEIKINSIGDILGSTFKDGAEYSKVTKTAIFFSFWGDIVGKKYLDNTKPYSYNLGKLYVSCKNSFILQEISLYKKDLIKKANIYSKAVDLNIDDIVFGYKNWNDLFKTSADDMADVDTEEIDFSKFDFGNEQEIKNMVDKIDFLDENQKNKLMIDIKNNVAIESAKRKN